MILTWELIESGRSERGGWSRNQVAVFGVRWPLKKGWKRRIIGRDFPEAAINEFMLLRNAHLKPNELDGQFMTATEGI